MADGSAERAHRLRAEYHSQTARIGWHDLQTYYAGGSVIAVSASLDLVEVAVQLGLDNTERFSNWITAGDIAPVSEERALAWYETNADLWAVVAAPWVLVQQREWPEASREKLEPDSTSID